MTPLDSTIDLSLAILRFFAPAALVFVAGFRQHRLWVVMPYAFVIAPLTIMVKDRIPYSNDPNMGSFSQGPVVDFLAMVFFIAVIIGVVFLGARYIGRFFKRRGVASTREHLIFVAALAAMYAVLHIVAYFYGIGIIPI